ncbi:OLC1v1035869C2 [Oldenlandia corymbosa var. corymbosa]|nr:OLC1v1035869C2 [Oldenlandia corymbosa var. corymbosa]
MESQPTFCSHKLFARLVLIQEEARNLMGGILDEGNGPSFKNHLNGVAGKGNVSGINSFVLAFFLRLAKGIKNERVSTSPLTEIQTKERA